MQKPCAFFAENWSRARANRGHLVGATLCEMPSVCEQRSLIAIKCAKTQPAFPIPPNSASNETTGLVKAV
jgi:hypothetical protein